MDNFKCTFCSDVFMSWSRAIGHVKTRHFDELASNGSLADDCIEAVQIRDSEHEVPVALSLSRHHAGDAVGVDKDLTIGVVETETVKEVPAAGGKHKKRVRKRKSWSKKKRPKVVAPQEHSDVPGPCNNADTMLQTEMNEDEKIFAPAKNVKKRSSEISRLQTDLKHEEANDLLSNEISSARRTRGSLQLIESLKNDPSFAETTSTAPRLQLISPRVTIERMAMPILSEPLNAVEDSQVMPKPSKTKSQRAKERKINVKGKGTKKPSTKQSDVNDVEEVTIIEPDPPHKTSRPPQYKTSKSNETVKKTSGGGVEIKLDSLKASEIEALMSQICSGTGHSLSGTTRTQRQAAAKAAKTVLMDNAEDDIIVGEEPKTVNPRKRKSDIDNNYIYESDSDYDPGDEDDSAVKTRKRRSGKGTTGVTYYRAHRLAAEAAGVKATCPFNCETKEFETSKAFFDHLKSTHMTPDGKSYECSYCSETFPEPFRNLNKHLREIHYKGVDGTIVNFHYSTEKKYPCPTCGKKFMYERALKVHEETHEKKDNLIKKFKCPLCESKFLRKDVLEKHFVIHLENNPFICKVPECNAKFARWEHFHRHVLLHTHQRFFKCDKCQGKFARQDALKRHLRRHNMAESKGIELRNIRNNCRPVVQLATSGGRTGNENDAEIRVEFRSLDLTDHIVTTESGDMTHHLKGELLESTTSNQSDDIIQVKTEAVAGSLYGLQREELLHIHANLRDIILADPVYQKLLKDDPDGAALVFPVSDGYELKYQEFKCPHCAWGTKRSYYLQQHLKEVHNLEEDGNDEAPSSSAPLLLCGSCGFHSSSSQELSEHMKTHKKSKPIPCSRSNCWVRFKTQAARLKHERIVHAQDYSSKHICDQCPTPTTFATRRNLANHKMMKHAKGEPSFKCPYTNCSKVFSTKDSLRKHKNYHNGVEKPECKICGQICSTKSSLKRHIDYVHLKRPNPFSRGRNNETEDKTEKGDDASSEILGL